MRLVSFVARPSYCSYSINSHYLAGMSFILRVFSLYFACAIFRGAMGVIVDAVIVCYVASWVSSFVRVPFDRVTVNMWTVFGVTKIGRFMTIYSAIPWSRVSSCGSEL